MTESLEIGARRALFVDDHLIDHLEDLERVFHPATRRAEPVIVADRPWEQRSFLGVLGNCVFYDEEEACYKLFYISYEVLPNGSERQHNAFALSRDGLRWEKPDLGIAHYRGSAANNLLADFDSPRFERDFWTFNNVFKDPRDPDPARRFKALGHGAFNRRSAADRNVGVIVAFSPDGLRWSEPPENPVLPNSDTHTLLGWDERIGKYVAYPRTGPGRCIGYSTSDDFLQWTEARTVLAPGSEDPPDYQIYGMPVFRYEDLYLGLPWAFINAGFEPLDTQLVVSRDGINWRKVGGGRMFLPRGPAGAFDDCYALCAAPVKVGDELWFYYMGCGFPHGPQFRREGKWEGAIGLARLRLDGFVSLACPMASGGEVTTRPLTFSGRRLVVNCNCPDGWLRAELQDLSGRPCPGFAEAECDLIRADSIRHVVTWQGRGDVAALAGKPVRLKLRVGDGELFSFGFID